jgi:hypothetical protein
MLQERKERILYHIYTNILHNYEINQQDALYKLKFFPSRFYMFRAMFSPIIRSTCLFLQYLVVFIQVAAGSNLGEHYQIL